MFSFLKTYQNRLCLYIDRGYQFITKFLEEKFQNCTIFIPPNVRRTDGDIAHLISQSNAQSSKRKRVLTPQEADEQERIELFSIMHAIKQSYLLSSEF